MSNLERQFCDVVIVMTPVAQGRNFFAAREFIAG